jgi:hypothetical protein
MIKKEYLSPSVESIELKTRNILMASADGDLGDLGEITIITDSVIDGPDEFLFF